MYTRQSLQQLNCNFDFGVHESMKTLQISKNNLENFKMPQTTKPQTMMQSLQGLTKFFSKDKEKDTKFQSVQQQVNEMKQKTTCTSLSPKQVPFLFSDGSPNYDVIKSLNLQQNMQPNEKHKIDINRSRNKSKDELSISKLTNGNKKPKLSNLITGSKSRSASIALQSDFSEQYQQLQTQMNNRVEQLEQELEQQKQNQGQDQLIQILKQNNQLKKQIVDKDLQLQSQVSKIIIFEKQLKELNQQVVQLTMEKEQQNIILQSKEKELCSLKQIETNFNLDPEFKRLYETEKSFEKIKQQIPYLTTAMKNLQSIFESLDTIPKDENAFEQNNLSLSNTSMVEMINEIKEPLKHNQLNLLSKEESSNGLYSNKNRKSQSLSQIIQKHLSKRETHN